MRVSIWFGCLVLHLSIQFSFIGQTHLALIATSCILRVGSARSGCPRSENGFSQPEPAAVTAGEGPSASRSEKYWSRLSLPPTRAATQQSAAEGKPRASALSRSKSSGCHTGNEAESHRGDVDWNPSTGSRGDNLGREGAGETRGGSVSMFYYLSHAEVSLVV